MMDWTMVDGRCCPSAFTAAAAAKGCKTQRCGPRQKNYPTNDQGRSHTGARSASGNGAAKRATCCSSARRRSLLAVSLMCGQHEH